MVGSSPYIPDCGDLVWLDFSPQAGHEQAGRRPALVISPQSYNRKVGMALFCPVTNQKKGYPFEVDFPGECAIQGVILADHVKNMDWKKRRAEYIMKVSDAVLQEVLGKLRVLVS